MDILSLVGRKESLVDADESRFDKELSTVIETARVLVGGGAGSIGQAVTKDIFKRTL